jgi:hypothetical protein
VSNFAQVVSLYWRISPNFRKEKTLGRGYNGFRNKNEYYQAAGAYQAQQQEREAAQELVKTYGAGLGEYQGVLGEPHWSAQNGQHQDVWEVQRDPVSGKLNPDIKKTHLPSE